MAETLPSTGADIAGLSAAILGAGALQVKGGWVV